MGGWLVEEAVARLSSESDGMGLIVSDFGDGGGFGGGDCGDVFLGIGQEWAVFV